MKMVFILTGRDDLFHEEGGVSDQAETTADRLYEIDWREAFYRF